MERKKASKKDKRQKKMKSILGRKRGTKKPPKFTTVLLVVVGILLVSSYGYGLLQEKEEVKNPSISEIVTAIQNRNITSLIVSGPEVSVVYTDDTKAVLRKDAFEAFDQTLLNLGVTAAQLGAIEYRIEKETGFGVWVKNVLPFLFPILILLLFIWFITRQAKGVGMQVFQFGRSRARFINPNDKANRVTFKDVAGAQEAKQELQEFVEFLKQPERFFAIGSKVPKGVLLTGAPGTGKTLLARAVAGEANVPFFSISGSEFVEMFVGVGASRVRDLFANAKKTAPAIVFIDEIDAVGRARGSGLGGGNDEREQALNQILVEMDGFEQTDKVIVLASTNRADILDTALLRPGRFDRKVTIDLPDIKERKEIIAVHARGKKLEEDVDFTIVARRTPGLSGADLASVVNEAGILAVRDNRTKIGQGDLLASIEKVLFGPERPSRVITDHERRVIAYHEAGHALLASLLPFADPVQKITIVSRGHAGGYVLSLPDTERRLKTRKELIDNITMALGGYVAEEIVFQDLSTGPSSDLKNVSELAHSMVTRFGMSSKIGPIVLRQKQAGAFGSVREGHAPTTEQEIDTEIEKIVKDAHARATEILTKHRSVLDVLVVRLLEVETLERGDYEEVLRGEGIEIQNELGK